MRTDDTLSIMRRLAPLLAAMALLALPAHATDTAPPTERLLVGKTNIFCVRSPCPWRGISRAEDERPSPSRLIWSGDDLPRLDASDEDAERITLAWDANECLAVDGSLKGETLHVERVVGACP